MSWIGGIEVFDAALGEVLADRLEVTSAMLFDERLEERHAEHLAFAFVDARGEVFVDLVAEEVPAQERSAAMRLHEQFDGGFLLGLAAEDLGDDAFQLAAIALVDQPATPGDQRVGPSDEAGQAG